MYLERPLSATVSMAVLLLSLAVFSVISTGFVLGIVARFKKLRNYANILIANLALVDLLNALINMPMYLLYGVLEVNWFKGKTLAIISAFLYGLFLLLNITSMLVPHLEDGRKSHLDSSCSVAGLSCRYFVVQFVSFRYESSRFSCGHLSPSLSHAEKAFFSTYCVHVSRLCVSFGRPDIFLTAKEEITK